MAKPMPFDPPVTNAVASFRFIVHLHTIVPVARLSCRAGLVLTGAAEAE